jgi:hypothetical protein
MSIELLDIRESGSNALLKYALSHKVNLLKNQNFKNIINDEFHYFITIGPVSFIELFQLLQVYRENPTVHIMENCTIDIPPSTELNAYGPLRDQVRSSYDKAISLVQQMMNDGDIPLNVATLYVPIGCRTFNIRIPITFSDVIHSIDQDEYNKVFNESYPHPDDFDILRNSKSLRNAIGMMIAQNQPVTYNAKTNMIYDSILYKPLQTFDGDGIYKIGLSQYGKLDPITTGMCLYDENIIGEPISNAMASKLKKFRTPLKASYVVQMPIYMLKELMLTYPSDTMEIKYISGINHMAAQNIPVDDFMWDGETLGISKYKSRILDVYSELMTLISSASNDPMMGNSYRFNMMMGITPATAIITLSEDQVNYYTSRASSQPYMESFMHDLIKDFSKLILYIDAKAAKYKEV